MEGLKRKSCLSTQASSSPVAAASISAVSDCRMSAVAGSRRVTSSDDGVLCKQHRLLMGEVAAPTSDQNTPAAVLHKLVIEFPVLERSTSLPYSTHSSPPPTARIYRGSFGSCKSDSMSAGLPYDELKHTTSQSSGEIITTLSTKELLMVSVGTSVVKAILLWTVEFDISAA